MWDYHLNNTIIVKVQRSNTLEASHLYMTFCTHGPRLEQRSKVSDTATVHIAPCLNIVESIHHEVLPPEEVIVVYVSLCPREDLVLLGIDAQV